MIKKILFLIFVPVLASSAHVKTEVETNVSGSNASVHSEARTVVNGKETVVTSDEPGLIEIEAAEKSVKITTKTPSPTPLNSKSEALEAKPKPLKTKNANFFSHLDNFLRRIFSKIIKIF